MDRRYSTPPFTPPRYPILSPDTPARSLVRSEELSASPSLSAMRISSPASPAERGAVGSTTARPLSETASTRAVADCRTAVPPRDSEMEGSEEDTARGPKKSRVSFVIPQSTSSASSDQRTPSPVSQTNAQTIPAREINVTSDDEQSSTPYKKYLHPVRQRPRVATPWPGALPANNVDNLEDSDLPIEGGKTLNNDMSAPTTVTDKPGNHSSSELSDVASWETTANPDKSAKGSMGPPPLPPRVMDAPPSASDAATAPWGTRRGRSKSISLGTNTSHLPKPAKKSQKGKEPDRSQPPPFYEPLETVASHPGEFNFGTWVPPHPGKQEYETWVRALNGNEKKQTSATVRTKRRAKSLKGTALPGSVLLATNVAETDRRFNFFPSRYGPGELCAPVAPKAQPFSYNAEAGPSRPRGKRSYEDDDHAEGSNTRRKIDDGYAGSRRVKHSSTVNYDDLSLDRDGHNSESSQGGALEAFAAWVRKVTSSDQTRDLVPDDATNPFPKATPELGLLANRYIPGDRILPIEHCNAYNPPSLSRGLYNNTLSMDSLDQGPDFLSCTRGASKIPQVKPWRAGASNLTLPAMENTYEEYIAEPFVTPSSIQPPSILDRHVPENTLQNALQETHNQENHNVPGPSVPVDHPAGSTMSGVELDEQRPNEDAEQKTRIEIDMLKQRIKTLNEQLDAKNKSDSQ